MSLKPEGINPIPEETARLAHGASPKGNVFMHMRDELGAIYPDETFAHWLSPTGQPAEAPWRLAFVTIVRFITAFVECSIWALYHACTS